MLGLKDTIDSILEAALSAAGAVASDITGRHREWESEGGKLWRTSPSGCFLVAGNPGRRVETEGELAALRALFPIPAPTPPCRPAVRASCVGKVKDIREALEGSLGPRYRIDREVGRGGNAIVFQAHDTKHTRDVAIKVLRPELMASVAVDRFLQEIEMAAHLQHPNIIPLFDSGDAEGYPYYVMPYFGGQTLRDRLDREGALPIDDFLALAKDVGDALAFAHDHKIIHRDIKPENIILSGGRALVADFGIARALVAASERFTDSGLAIGTPEYMSPEQGGADPIIDARSDIYSLGCVLYEVMAGDPPFTGRTAQAIISKHQHERLPSLEIVRPGIPRGIVDTLETALAKVPADRFATASEFVHSLVRGSTSERATFEVTPERPGPDHKTRLVVLSAGAVAVAAVAAAVFLRPDGDLVPLDANRVMGVPFVETGFPDPPTGLGEIAALRIGSAFDQTDPLKFEWGRSWLDSNVRNDIAQLSGHVADSIARARGARYRFEGEVVTVGDSANVILRLYDTGNSELVDQRTAVGLADPEAILQLALNAARAILPALIGPGPVDSTLYLDRDVGAAALWMQGEREYRVSRFERALEFYERALDRDSSLVMAALKGALAANWKNLTSYADRLVDHALTRHRELRPRYGHFANGLKMYLVGNADSALYHVRSALDADTLWAEAWMLLGEVHRHLLTRETPPDSLARDAFERARTLDPEFTAPLYHLVEFALWGKDLPRADELAIQFHASDPDTSVGAQLSLILACAREEGSTSGVDWQRAADDNPNAVLQAGHTFARQLSYSACSKDAFAALLASEASSPNIRFDAMVGLQSVLMAERAYDSVRVVLNSAIASGVSYADAFFVLDAAAGGVGFDEGALRFVEKRRLLGQRAGRSLAAGDVVASYARFANIEEDRQRACRPGGKHREPGLTPPGRRDCGSPSRPVR